MDADSAKRRSVAHAWNLTPEEARGLQKTLAERLILNDQLGPVQTVAGVDIGFPRGRGITRAAVVVLRLDDLSVVEQAVAEEPTRFPYVPGLLSFREVPAALRALQRLSRPPDLLLCDGQGTAHPRRFGVACHLGLLSDIPAIGVAKSRLLGEHAPLAREKGAWQPLRDKGETIGAVLRSRAGVRPLYVSPGHRVSLETALHYTSACLGRYRLPETTRVADRLAGDRSA
ncbi:deoxyribonuclease V [Natronospira proteinivora]|uniref:Endonuclease V n=1 Tax=Natronospira proteinivora TaxID=1807133 RepID=A0ABT1G919_9GAMM|nr:deoxyribonuclease V [Natronospira proteinivora]MCP1727813.1 deoxyribonuclease V [Natronospira proteinivora]